MPHFKCSIYVFIIIRLIGDLRGDEDVTEPPITQKQNRLYTFLITIGIIAIAFNLRPAITSVGPLIGIIRLDLGLEHWSAGLLTSLPLLAFAVMSPIVPQLGNRFSSERMMVLGLIVIMAGISIRTIPYKTLLFGGTIFVGIGIAICNVLLPSVVKDKFPQKVGLMTSVYSTTMGVFAATASGLSAPLATGLNFGWKWSLFIWIIPAVIAIVIWIILINKNEKEKNNQIRFIPTSDYKIWKSPLAWQIALFMGLQSSLFYVTVSWLPEILQHNGLEITTAGWMLSYTQFIGLPVGFIIPVLADRMKRQHSLVLILGFLALFGFFGLLYAKSFSLIVISTTFIGITIGGTFPLALTFLALRARTAQHASQLSGMAQAIGYLVAALGPIFMGLLYDLTNDWTIPLIVLMIITCLVILFGLSSSRDQYVLDH